MASVCRPLPVDCRHHGHGQDDGHWVFSAQLQSSRALLSFLKAIHFQSSLFVSVGDNGLKMTVEDAKVFQANVFLQKQLFRYFHLSAPVARQDGDDADDADDADVPKEELELSFQLDLASLIDCLSMFAQPVLRLQYDSRPGGTPASASALKLWLEDAGVVVEITAKVCDGPPPVNFQFAKADVTCKVILLAEPLKEIFHELDGSSEWLEVLVAAHGFTFRTSSSLGQLEVELPAHSEMVTHFHVEAGVTMQARYKMSQLRYAFKPIALSEKVSIRMDGRQTLCLQYMVNVEEEQRSFLEFICLSQEDTNLSTVPELIQK